MGFAVPNDVEGTWVEHLVWLVWWANDDGSTKRWDRRTHKSPISGKQVKAEVFRTEKVRLAKTATKLVLHALATVPASTGNHPRKSGLYKAAVLEAVDEFLDWVHTAEPPGAEMAGGAGRRVQPGDGGGAVPGATNPERALAEARVAANLDGVIHNMLDADCAAKWLEAHDDYQLVIESLIHRRCTAGFRHLEAGLGGLSMLSPLKRESVRVLYDKYVSRFLSDLTPMYTCTFSEIKSRRQYELHALYREGVREEEPRMPLPQPVGNDGEPWTKSMALDDAFAAGAAIAGIKAIEWIGDRDFEWHCLVEFCRIRTKHGWPLLLCLCVWVDATVHTKSLGGQKKTTLCLRPPWDWDRLYAQNNVVITDGNDDDPAGAHHIYKPWFRALERALRRGLRSRQKRSSSPTEFLTRRVPARTRSSTWQATKSARLA